MKQKRILSFLLSFVMVLSMFPTNFVFADETTTTSIFADGSGLASDPYQIATLKQLEDFRDSVVNEGNTYGGFHVQLTADIDLKGSENNQWLMTGDDADDVKFEGTFDGNGKTISGLYFNYSSNESFANYGFFGRIINATIKNLTVIGEMSTTDATIVRKGFGGVVGYASDSTISNCHSNVKINGGSKSCYVGGVVGYANNSTITNCTNKGDVRSTSSDDDIGGICGIAYNGTTIENCINEGKVSGTKNVGGIAGDCNGATIKNCANKGDVSGTKNVGGIAGKIWRDNSAITSCYNIGNVSGATYVGGIAGYGERGNINDTYNVGTVTGNDYVGGIVGHLPYNSAPTIDYCDINCAYNVGDVVGDTNVGQIYGAIVQTSKRTVSGIYALDGTEDGYNSFDEQSTFVGFDFGNTWVMSDTGIAERPLLKNNKEVIGTVNNPHKIATLKHLENFSESVGDGTDYDDEYILLLADIDMSGTYGEGKGASGENVSWTPIGYSYYKSFNGTFDGDGHKIENLYYSDKNNGLCVGFFGYLGKNGTVENLAVSGTVEGNMNVGGIVGYNNGTVKNCYNLCTVSAQTNTAGGIEGANYSGTVTRCYNEGVVTGEMSGAITGYTDNTLNVTDCYFLSTTCSVGIGKHPDGEFRNVKEKTADELQSGEVAWLLQNGQSEQYWGQKLGTDNYPVLTSDSANKVYKVSFKVKDSENEGQYKDYAVKYANTNTCLGGNFPDSAFGNYKIVKWVLDKDNKDSTEFTKDTVISEDKEVYGVKNEITYPTSESTTIDCNKNAKITVDLEKYVENKSGNDKKFAFTIDEENSTLDMDWIDGTASPELDITFKKAGTYTLKVKVANDNTSLASITVPETSTTLPGPTVSIDEITEFTLTFNVDLEGEGTQTKPYLIYDLTDLEYFRDKVNSGTYYEGKFVKLVDDIDMSAKYGVDKESWTPIGKKSFFKGNFDGNDKTISGLYINKQSSTAGFFSIIGEEGTVKKLTLKGDVTGKRIIGGLAGSNQGTIEDCTVECTVTGTDLNNGTCDVGGIAGHNDGTIKNCTVKGTVKGKWSVGGIAGCNNKKIENCKNEATIKPTDDGTEYNNFGGIAGLVEGTATITGCENSGNVECGNVDKVGGIVGENYGAVKKCSNSGDISAKSCVGGIAGYNAGGSIDNCFNSGNIYASHHSVGGICGESGYYPISNCYNIGKISESDDGTGQIGAIIGYGGNIQNCFYLKDCVTQFPNVYTANLDGTESTEDEFNSGVVAFKLQMEQLEMDAESNIIQVWGQELNETDSTKNDKYPVLTDKKDKTVYALITYVDGNRDYYYVEYWSTFGNDGDTVTLGEYTGANKDMFRGWYTESGDKYGFIEDDKLITEYTINSENALELYSVWNTVSFEVTNTRQTYQSDTPRTITLNPKLNGESSDKLNAEDFDVKYYLVNENKNELYATTPESKTISAGKYLYVITLKAGSDSAKYGYIKSEYTVGTSTDLPDIEDYDNIGYMYITSGVENAQKPIFFAKQTVNAKMTDTVDNPLTNPNASTVTYESSDTSVATVDGSGSVTIRGAGSTVIVATSKKENSSDVYASYTLNVTKEVVTVTANNKDISYGDAFANDGYTVSKDGVSLDGTASYTTDYKEGDGIGKYEINVSGLSSDLYEIEYKSGTLKVNAKELTAKDFEVTVNNKPYDGSDKAEVTAKVNDDSLVSGDVVTVLVSGTFDKLTVDASKVNYTISGLSGKDSSNYVVKNDISGSRNASIAKAKVTVSVPKYTSYVYDGDGKSVSVFAYANGIYFDKFKVTYNGNTTLPNDKGTYTVGIILTDSNYELVGDVDAQLEIKSAQQDVFSIEGISDTVTYGDELTLQTAGAIEDGSVSYAITSGSEFATLSADNKITTRGVGTVTVTATSTKDNYEPKTATRTFVIKPKTISVAATADEKVYDGTKNVKVDLMPIGVLSGDSVTVSKTSATVATADVENGKTVFVSGLSIDNSNYQLASTSVQTTVDITKKPIKAIKFTAADKAYDGTDAVLSYTIGELTGVIDADKSFVTVSGTAKFDSANVNDVTKATLSDLVLSGTKSGNYTLEQKSGPNNTFAISSVDDKNAKITKATVNFEFGTLSYVYDGKAKTVPVTATAGGKAFNGYTVAYSGEKEQTDVGKYYIEIALTDSNNYTSAYTTGDKQLEITTADQSAMTITGLLGTIEYGRSFALNAVGGSSDIAATWESSDANIATVDPNTGVVTIKGVDEEVTITATKAANRNFSEQTASVTFTPVKKAASFRISKLNQVYDGTPKSVEVASIDTGAVVKYYDEDGKEVTNPTNAGTYYVEVTAGENYEGEQNAVLTIKKAKYDTENISLAISENIVYGTTYDVTVNGYSGTDGIITYTGTGLYGGQDKQPTNAGSYTATLTISNANYETATITKKFEIAKAKLYAKPDNQLRAYGEQNPVFTIKYYSDSACENEVTNADVMITPVMSTAATASATVGNYDICATGGYAENYKFEYVNGTLTIGRATGGNFYINGGNTNPYVGNKFTLTAYYNNEKPTVEWTSNAPAIATVDKSTGEVEIVGTGEAVITATMKDSRFDNSLKATFKLTAARLPENQNAIIFETPIVEKFANDGKFTITPTNVSDGATVKYKSSNSEIATVDESTGEVTINKVGTVVITATATKFNCPDVYASYKLSIKKIPVTITADDKTITYGDTFEGTATFSDNLKAEDFSGTLGFNTRYTVGKDVDEYDVTPTGLTSDKYDITFVSGTITVVEKKLTEDDFTVTAENKAYDGTKDVEISASVNDSAVVGNDKLYVEINGSFEDENAGTGKTVNYDLVSLSGRGFENYTLDRTTGLTTKADINKAEVTFFVSSETVKNYDGTAQSVEISAMANGNVFGSENYTVYYQKDGEDKTTEPTNVGEYTVSVELNDSENYTVKDFTAKLKIEQDADIELTIKGSNKNVTVGDMFTLYAQYGNDTADVEWTSDDENVATVDENGDVTILKSGDVKITATMKDTNYGGLSADFDLTAAKKRITLSASATELVKVYNGKVQNINFTAGLVSLDDVTIDTSYVMTTDSSKTEPKDVGTYAVSYTIDDERYEGDGNFTLVINKATVTVSADTIEKEYGEEPEYKLIVSDNVEGINAETMKELVTITSDGAAKTANVGEYDINVELAKTSDENCNYVVNTKANGKLNVTKATLTVNVADITREYGAENPTELTYTIAGFKNDETADILTGSIAPVYAEGIEEKVGTQKDVVTALSTLENGNYTVEVKYADDEGADLTITKVGIKASAGASRRSYLTVEFDKALPGMEDKFVVKEGENTVELTDVTASSDNKTYTLKGAFTVDTAYTVEILLTSETHELTEGNPLTVTPTVTAIGGSGGGGGGSSGGTTSYTVTFETNGGSKIDSVKVYKNKTVAEPTAPIKDGFEFDGWYTDKKLTTEYDFDTKVTKAITLYAKWTEKDIDDNKDDNKEDDNKPSTSEWKNPFTDVTSADWFFENVKYANENGLMSGTTDTTFAPNDNLTRAMLVTVLYRAEGEPAVNKSIPFADVNASQYYANAVIWAQQNGIVKGVSETEFAPDENITREQIATIIYRYAEYKGIAPKGSWAIKLDYADVAEISDYAVEGVMYCTMKNIMQGKDNNMFAPKDNATRAEIAAILNRFIEGNK